MPIQSQPQLPASGPEFPKLTAVRLAVVSYEEDAAARERALDALSATVIATFTGGTGKKGPNAFGLACIIDGDAWLAFRGSDDGTDWGKNLHFRARRGVHGGFLGEWLKLRAQVLAWLKDHHHEFRCVNLTGHSLGGAIAMNCAREIFDIYPGAFGQIITFGAPPPFYEAAAENFSNKSVKGRPNGEALCYRTLRVVNQRDIVSWLPHTVGLRHVGELEVIGPPTLLASLGAIGKRMYDLISGNEPWGDPPVFDPEDPTSLQAVRRWSEREEYRNVWRSGGFQSVGILLLRVGSIALAPFWLTIYLVVRFLAIVLSIHHIFESGVSHLRRNYLMAMEPKPAWHSVIDSAHQKGR